MEALSVLEAENSLAISLAWRCTEPVENVLYFYRDTLTYDGSTDTFAGGSGASITAIDGGFRCSPGGGPPNISLEPTRRARENAIAHCLPGSLARGR